MKKELKIIVRIKEKFISVNNLYRPKIVYVNGRPKASTYKNPEAIKVEQSIRDQLSAVDFTDYMDFLKETKSFNFLVQFIFKNNVSRRDSSNYLKNLEDCWTRFVREDLGIKGYDDRLHTEVHSYKSIIPGADEEIACISLRESNFNMRLDYIEKPEKIYLHSPYPKGLKTAWSKEKIYDVEPKDYNTDLWLISDPELSPILTSKIIQSLYAHREKGYCIVGVKNDLEREVFEPIVEGHGNLIVTEQENLLEVIKKLRE